MKNLTLLIPAIFVTLFIGCNSNEDNNNSTKAIADRLSQLDTLEKYNDVLENAIIGNLTWSSKNACRKKYSNGEIIPHARNTNEWISYSDQGIGCWCYINDDTSTEAQFGLLYNWYAINDTRGIAPVGWRVPQEEDFRSLVMHIVNTSNEKVCRQLRSESGWEGNPGGNDGFGFKALPAGFRVQSTFKGVGKSFDAWSLTEGRSGTQAYALGIVNDNSLSCEMITPHHKSIGHSLRFVKSEDQNNANQNGISSGNKLEDSEYGEFFFNVPCGMRGWGISFKFIKGTDQVTYNQGGIVAAGEVGEASSNGSFVVDNVDKDFKYLTCSFKGNETYKLKYSIARKKWFFLPDCSTMSGEKVDEVEAD